MSVTITDSLAPTELPQIGERQFFRVAYDELHCYYTIQLRYRRRFGSKPLDIWAIGSNWSRPTGSQPPTEQQVIEAAHELMKKRSAYFAGLEKRAAILGDYPPKKLGGTR